MKNRTIIFSKNRAMQLDLLIRSLLINCDDFKNLNIKVLYKCDLEHRKSYDGVMESFRAFVDFEEETNFKENLIELTEDSDYILFLVDDTIFFRGFNIEKKIGVLKKIPSALGYSFRLGKNIDYCYSLNISQSLGKHWDISSNDIAFNWCDKGQDFGYPLEVSSSLYRKDDIFQLLVVCNYHNPNELESLFDLNHKKFDKSLLLCGKESCAFSSPMNLVQKGRNRYSEDDDNFSSEKLMEVYESGKRISLDPFLSNDFKVNSPHMEVKFEYVDRND